MVEMKVWKSDQHEQVSAVQRLRSGGRKRVWLFRVL